MIKEIKIYNCGTEVITKIGKVKAIITAVSIRFGRVQYEISYFNNGERKDPWLNENEFTTSAVKNLSIGFKTND